MTSARGAGPLLLAALMAGSAAAQGYPPTTASGTVVKPGQGGTVPVPGVRVVLHRIGRATQGPIDTVVTDARGRFRFSFPADTSANFILSSNFAGIEYFSQPLATNPARPDTGLAIQVFDTSSTVSVATRTRTVVIAAPDPIGARTVIDWMTIENRAGRTRIGSDENDPTWKAALPAGVRNPVVGDARLSQISPDAVLFRDDSVFVLAPLSPGPKELLLQYEVPPAVRRLELSLGATDSADAFLEEGGAGKPGAGWQVRDSQLFQGRPFRRLVRNDASITTLSIDLPGPPIGAITLPLLVGITALALALVTVVMLRRGPAGAPVTPVSIADRIVRLDQAAAAEQDAAARERLAADRSRLMESLRAALARRGGES